MPVTRTSGQGRPKGAANKTTSEVKAMVIAALQRVGGIEYLAARALDQPVAFMALVGRVMPLQLEGSPEGGAVIIQVVTGVPEPDEPPTIDADSNSNAPCIHDT